MAVLFYVLFPLILLVVIVDLATMGADKRQRLTVNRLYASGFSQRTIASHLGITRHRVRCCLA
jgi:DNA-binding transcriptional regulator LsrR (DeoR family)